MSASERPTPVNKLVVNGSVAGIGPYKDISDARYKKNIGTITNALDKVQKIRGVQFDWRRKKFSDLAFDEGHLIPVLVEAIKEQNKLVSGLKQELRKQNNDKIALESELQITKSQLTEFDALKAEMAQMEVSVQKLLAAQDKTSETSRTLSKVAYQSR